MFKFFIHFELIFYESVEIIILCDGHICHVTENTQIRGWSALD